MRRNVNIHKTVLTVIIINIVQIMFIAAVVIDNYMKSESGGVPDLSKESLILFIIIFSVIINSIIMIKNIFFYNIKGTENQGLKISLEQMEKLNITLRAQRHDFMNHLQVVYSLIEMQEFNEASNYIETIYKDIQRVNKVLKTSSPAINALLQAKSIYCEQKYIDMQINISTQLKDLKIPSWEICRVLGNIIDNSVQALEQRVNIKIIEVNIYEDIKGFVFKIKNNGPKIPPQLHKKIFEPGFTTKGEHGDGMGLAISYEIVEMLKGDITLSSDEEWTEFSIFIPNSN